MTELFFFGVIWAGFLAVLAFLNRSQQEFMLLGFWALLGLGLVWTILDGLFRLFR